MKEQAQWPTAARGAMERLITQLNSELGEQATIAEIEQAVLRHYQELLSEVV